MRLRRAVAVSPAERQRVQGACEEFVRVCRCIGYDTANPECGDAANVLLARVSSLAAAKFHQRGTTSVTSAPVRSHSWLTALIEDTL